MATLPKKSDAKVNDQAANAIAKQFRNSDFMVKKTAEAKRTLEKYPVPEKYYK